MHMLLALGGTDAKNYRRGTDSQTADFQVHMIQNADSTSSALSNLKWDQSVCSKSEGF